MADQHQNEKSLFLAALEIDSDLERAEFLKRACEGNPQLKDEVDALLQAHAKSQPILDAAPFPGPTIDQPMADSVGSVIGPYKLIEQIGEGGMGTVWMAQQTSPVKRVVALKLIKAGMDSKLVIARFEAERQALALMDHANICRVLDAGATSAGRPYFVMDLVKGVPITRYCDEHHLTPRQRLELFIPICQAVQHAHQKGIIHRDLKPTNVLVALYDGRPVPKVIDFGVAKAAGPSLTDKTLVTGFGAIVGTIEYMSPEQAEINQLDIDTRSDIYSLGVLLYELLAGSPPFSRKELEKAGMLEMLRVIREQEPSKPSTKLSTAEGLPSLAANRGTEPTKLAKLMRGELDWIVMKALEKDRNRRYETANGFATDVQRYLADEPVAAGPPSAWYRVRKFARRNKGPVLAASIVVLTLVGGIAGTTWGMVRAARERDDKANALLAETDAKEAEKKARVQALAALRAMTDEIVENQMARGTNLSDENKEFLRKIIKHFEGFAAIATNDFDSQSIRAEGYHRVGMMRMRLGELKEAEAAFGDAFALRKKLADDFPAHLESRQELAKIHSNLGNLYSTTGRLKEAEMAYADAVALGKQLIAESARPEFRQELGRFHNNLAALLYTTSRLQEAESAYGDALAIRTRLVAEYPDRPEFRDELSASQHNLGVLFRITGRLKDAETAYVAVLAIQKQLAAEFPARPEYRRQVAMTHLSLSNIFTDTGRLKESEEAHHAALAIRRRLAADFPARPEYRQDLAMSHNNLGNLLYDLGRREKAEAAYIDALALRKQLASDFPSRPGFRFDLASSYNCMGALLSDTNRLKEADESYGAALALFERLAADFPSQPDRPNAAAAACVNLAVLRVQQRDFKGAKACLEKASPYHASALKANPRNPTYRLFFVNNLRALVQANAGLGDQAGAVDTAKKLCDLGWDPPANTYSAACSLALCIPIVQNDGQSTKDTRDKQVQFYGDESLKLLGHAVVKGYKNFQHMKKDRDLDPLRERADFQKLLKELEAQRK